MDLIVSGKKCNADLWTEFDCVADEKLSDDSSSVQAYDRSSITEEFKGQLCENHSSSVELLFGGLDAGYVDCPSSFSRFEYVDCKDEYLAVGDVINCFLSMSNSVSRNMANMENIRASKDILDAFFQLSKTVVFNPNSDLLYNMSFRKSDFLEDLILFGSQKYYKKEKREEKTDCDDKDETLKDEQIVSYCFGPRNPFVLESLRQICNNIKLLSYQTEHNKDSLLRALRCEIFLRRAERNFNRFIRANNLTHRVSLNRHNSELSSWPYYELSSIEEIKPIRLFEKIVTYINTNIDTNDKDFYVNVSIIGHTEVSKNKREKELADLLVAIMSWYDLYAIENCVETKLRLKIVNYVNKGDWPSYNEHRVKKFDCIGKNCISSSEIRKVNYAEYFALSLYNIDQIISDNNLIFILDCPWLTSENLDIKKNSTLEHFCNEIEQIKTEEYYKCEDLSVNSPERLDSNEYTLMKYLDSQYNRIMTSSTLNAGSIVRVFKDNVIKKIQKLVSKHKGEIRKELYIFSSENEGLAYSYVLSHPLSRLELYEGKEISIFQFCNYKPQMLAENKDEQLAFNIRLWSILKYTSIAYAYIDFSGIVAKCFGKLKLNAEDYYEIYRNVYVVMCVDDSMSDVNVSIKIGNSVKLHFSNRINEKKLEVCLEKLVRYVETLLRELCSEVVFSSNDGFGNTSIRQAFSMNIYSAIHSVREMMFWHKYRMAMIKNNFESFNVSYHFNKEIEYTDTINYEQEIFMDKKVYDLVLLSSEYQNRFSLGLKSMLYSCEDVFEASNIHKRIIYNILDECEKIGNKADNIKWNLTDSLKEMY